MAASGPQLNHEQREQLLQWLAAEYSVRLILDWMAERGWPSISDRGVRYHRENFAEEIAERRKARRSRALNSGLALKEERVERLKDHADQLEAIKWVPDEKGKLHNEKAWRETLEQIEIETGQRKTNVENTVNMNLKRWENVNVEDV